jgi:large subunit ribosomal protein L24
MLHKNQPLDKEMRLMKLKIKKGDSVTVNTGADKGKTGKVLKVYTNSLRVTVEGVNFKKRHVKPTQTSPQGGITTKEYPIHYSNIQKA